MRAPPQFKMAQTNAYRTVRHVFQAKAKPLELRILGGANGLDNRITSPRIQKLGLGLAGYTEYLDPGRVQFIGRTEAHLLMTLNESERREALKRVFELSIACVVVAGGTEPPPEMLLFAREYAVPLLLTLTHSARAIDEITEFLEERLAPSTAVHGVLVDVFGLGVLIFGRSGIGKSECALELIMRGHRLVSDDLVTIRQSGPDRLMGCGPEQMKYHMEVRGLGIINIRDLFGISSVMAQKQLDLAVELVHWREWQEDDRISFDERRYEVLEAWVPQIVVPVASGRNVATLVEVAVRLQLLKKQGYQPAAAFLGALERQLQGVEDDGVD